MCLLRSNGKIVRVGRRVRLIGDLRKRVKHPRRRLYDDAVLEKLKQIWAITDCICGKRLVAILPEVIPVLERHHEIVLSKEVRDGYGKHLD